MGTPFPCIPAAFQQWERRSHAFPLEMTPGGDTVDANGLHGLTCKGGSGRSACHHGLNDLIWPALSKADIPATKEPSVLLRTDGKRRDGVTHLPRKNERCAAWDVTVTDTMAQSYLHNTSRTSGAAAEVAADKKTAKNAPLAQTYVIVPIDLETMGVINSD